MNRKFQALALAATVATMLATTPAVALAAEPPSLQEIQLQEILEDAIEAHNSEVSIGDEYDISTSTAYKLIELYYGCDINGVASEKQTRFLLYANRWGVERIRIWAWVDTGALCRAEITYKYSKAKVAKAQKKLNAVAKKVKKIKGTTARTKYVTKWTTAHLRYAGNNTGTIEAMTTGKAMCYGYALVTLDILRTAGVKDARYVTCSTIRKGDPINHALCKIGKTYTDTCWADRGKVVNWKWFNKSHRFMNKHDHHF